MKIKLESENEPFILRKIIFFSCLTWIPILLLSAIQSTAYNPVLKVYLLSDYVVWTRFFIALPILIYSERTVSYHVGKSVSHFINAGIITQESYPEYESVLKKIANLRDSKIAELVILVFSYTVVLFFWKVSDERNMTSSWLFINGNNLSLAGYWYYYLGAPLFQFILYRFIWKFLLWSLFLYYVSNMDLKLFPINPDLSGGLNFLGVATFFFGYFGIAQGSVVSAQIAEFIVVNKVQLSDFKITIFLNILVLLLLFIFPLLFFTKKLVRIRFNGMIDYGIISQKYVGSFQNKWIKTKNLSEPLLGTPDIQSLADLFNSFQIISKMRIVPFNINQIIFLIILVIIPFFPLIFFIIPPIEILKFVFETFI